MPQTMRCDYDSRRSAEKRLMVFIFTSIAHFRSTIVPRFSQPQLDAADAVIALAKSVSGGELTIDDIANVIVEKVHPVCFQSLKVSLVNSLLAVEKVCSDFEEQQDRKRRNSHA